MTRDTGGLEHALEAVFAAARTETPEPRVAFLTAILADAAEVSAARARAAPSAPVEAASGRWRGLRALLDALGGWRGATALGACAALGFWIGLAGGGDFAVTSYPADTASSDSPADPVAAFFDLASVEG